MRRRYRRPRHRALLLFAVLACVVALRLWQGWSPQGAAPEALAEGSYRVERVVDGDTLLLTGGARVRLIGVDTPETVKPRHPPQPWGAEATEFSRNFVAGGEVRLQLDHERIDRFGRFLAYVWVDEAMLNEELLRAGLARFEEQFHYSQSMKTRFRQAQQQAQAAGLGIWSAPPSPQR